VARIRSRQQSSVFRGARLHLLAKPSTSGFKPISPIRGRSTGSCSTSTLRHHHARPSRRRPPSMRARGFPSRAADQCEPGSHRVRPSRSFPSAELRPE
jgi:hypothetical protein